MDLVLEYSMEHESDFQLSEVIEPGSEAGIIDYRQRRSRVLMDLGPHRKAITDRIHDCLPQVLAKLGHEHFNLRDVEVQITASNDDDYFHSHNDNSSQENATREITFVYFFHKEPKMFEGGELRIYDSRRDADRYAIAGKYRSVIPQQNQMVFFVSSLMHEITPVKCSSRSFADSRFTVNGWLHR
jgi:SM-20-related protein